MDDAGRTVKDANVLIFADVNAAPDSAALLAYPDRLKMRCQQDFAQDIEQLRAAILNMNLNTVYGGFKVDRDGVQIAHTMLMFQWQDSDAAVESAPVSHARKVVALPAHGEAEEGTRAGESGPVSWLAAPFFEGRPQGVGDAFDVDFTDYH